MCVCMCVFFFLSLSLFYVIFLPIILKKIWQLIGDTFVKNCLTWGKNNEKTNPNFNTVHV
jgi:hypothetical protein